MKKQLLLAVLLVMIGGFSAGAGAAPEEPLLTFPVISDIHVRQSSPLSQRKYKAALQDLHNVDPNMDALVINGDLTNGLNEDYVALLKTERSSPLPKNTFYTIGNHEYYAAFFPDYRKFPNGITERTSIDRFRNFNGLSTLYYDKWVNGYHFIFLGSERFRQSVPGLGNDAYLSDTQLNWLKAKLAQGAQPNKPIFVFLHQPLPNTVSGSHIERNIMQHEELGAILSGYPQVFFFSGHTHFRLGSPNTMVRKRFTMVNSSAVFDPYGVDNLPLEGNYSEGLYVQVYNDVVQIRGRDFVGRQWLDKAQYLIPLKRAE